MRANNKTLNSTNMKLLIFATILLSGTLIYSATLFILNICIPADQTPYFAVKGIPLLEIRWTIRRIVEIICGFCQIIYLVGTIVVLWYSVKLESIINLKPLLLFPIGTIAALFLCNVPFALLDKSFAVDYFITVLIMLGNIPLIFCITAVVSIRKNRRTKRKTNHYKN